MAGSRRLGFLGVMAWRETRGAWRHFLFFLVCIALGVGSLVGVSGFSATLERTVRKEARSLMAADVQVRVNRPLSDAGRAALESWRRRGAEVVAASELVAMAANPASDATALVELKAVEPGYPFYGELAVSPPEAARALADPAQALVEEGLLTRLGLEPGDHFQLGGADLLVAGVILKEPDRVVGAFSLGPRVLIGPAALAATELIQPGSRVRYRYLLKLPPGQPTAPVVEELETALAPEFARVSAYDDAQPRLQRFLQNLTVYLGLVGLISLLVGGIGVANSVRAFMQEKMDTLAVLKGLGADSPTLLRIYLLQTLLLGGLGSLAGLGLGVGVQWALPSLMAGLLPVRLEPVAAWGAMLRGVTMGVLTAGLFALWPLLGIRAVPPARLLRREVDEEAMFQAGGRRPWAVAAAIVSALALLALWHIGQWTVGATFLGVLGAALGLLWAGAWLLVRAARRLPVRRARLPLRQGVANLHRPGSQTVTALLSVGIGVTVMLAVALIEVNLLRQVDDHLPEDAPTFFFVDIQPDQADGFSSVLVRRGLPAELTPIVRSRLHAVGEETVAQMKLEGREDAWYFQREYVVTARAELPKGNRVVEGAWWPSRPGTEEPLISVEQEAARGLGVGLGSRLTFDAQGRLITATVASLREVAWSNLGTNFFIIFSPGALDALTPTYLATTRTAAPAEDLPLQRAVVAAFPNVTAINMRHVLDAIGSILNRIAHAVRFMAAFTLATGLLVLAGALAATRYRRIRETVILKALGATRGIIARIFAVEYAVLGVTAGLIGTGLACLLSYIVVRFFMMLPWEWDGAVLAMGLAAAVLLTVLTGFLTTLRVLGQKPLAVLRRE
ncbi:MAG: FtsX-like permease family protein [Nitrospirota bacterium]